MQWDGNPNIVLDIKTKLGVSLPVQVIRRLIEVGRLIMMCESELNHKK